MKKNNYKIKKKSLFKREIKSKKDFAWHASKSNPFTKEERLSWKQKIEIILIFVSVFSTFGFLIFHPYFYINNINIQGLKRIEKQEFLEAVNGAIDYKKFLVLPTESYLILSTNELEEVLKLKFALSSITVKKNFPNALSIFVEEEISTIIYDNGKQYSYLGLDGSIVEILRNVGDDEWLIETKSVTSTNEEGIEIQELKEISRKHNPPIKNINNNFGDYPILYDIRKKEGNVNDKMLQVETIRGILEWFSLLTN